MIDAVKPIDQVLSRAQTSDFNSIVHMMARGNEIAKRKTGHLMWKSFEGAREVRADFI